MEPDLPRLRKNLERLKAEHQYARRQVKEERKELKRAKRRVKATVEAQEILQRIAQSVQQQAHEQIAAIATRCLAAIFDDPYSLKIEFDRKRGKTEARIVFVRRGREFEPAVKTVGGGVIDVAAFALRLAVLLLKRPKVRRVMVLDEPFSKLRGRENRQRVRDMLQKLSEDFGIQFILSIDLEAYPEFASGKVIEV